MKSLESSYFQKNRKLLILIHLQRRNDSLALVATSINSKSNPYFSSCVCVLGGGGGYKYPGNT